MSTTEIVKQAYGFFTTGDIAGLLGTFSDNIEYRIKGEPYIPFGGTYNGKEAVMGFFQKLGETIDFTKFDLIELVTEGNKAMGIVDMGGTAKANGNSFSAFVVHRMHIEDGKIALFEDFPDTKVMNEAING